MDDLACQVTLAAAALATEEWRDIPGFTGRYQASSLGRFRSLDRQIRAPMGNGTMFRPMKGQIIKPVPDKGGSYRISTPQGSVSAAACMLEAFGQPRPGPGWFVNYLDLDRSNLAPTNLVWSRSKMKQA